MSIADKLTIIAENEQKVYEAGKTDFVNAIANGGEDFAYFFYNRPLTTVPQIDTSKGTDFSYMFQACSKLTEIPHLDTSKGINFERMFYNCKALTEVPQLDTSKGNSFRYMFYNCSVLTEVPQLDTSNAEFLTYMFANCTKLTEIPPLNAQNADGMGYLFSGCTSLITVHQLKVKSTTEVNNAFDKCSALKNVTFSGVIGQNKLNFSQSNLLTIESLRNIIDCLEDKSADISGTTWKITVGSTNFAKLNDEDLLKIETKGWTIA